ncbi:mRpL32 [Trypoxylus dichotomus]
MMASRLLNSLSTALSRIEQTIALAFGRRYPPEAYCIAWLNVENTNKQPPWSIKDILNDGFLWAVPKSRRTIEKRLKRKFGHPEYVDKLLRPKTILRTCNVCGDDHEVGVLCPSCYKQVIEETKAMQDKIQEELQLNPVENEVVILYDGEKDEKPSEFWEGKRIIEMKRPRPSWFSKNLTQQTTQQPATTSDVKPSNLG